MPIAKDDDFTFGVLHSRIHEAWARRVGTQLRERESGFRYTPRTTFDPFPFPRPSEEQRDAIEGAAQHLGGTVEYRATTAQWHADRRGRRPKVAKLATNNALRQYVQDRLGGVVAAPDGTAVPGPGVRWIGRRHGRRQDRRWATSRTAPFPGTGKAT